MLALATPSVPVDVDALHACYLTLLPRIETHARIYFRHLKCPDRREDAVQDTIGLAWKWFVRLAERGKDATRFPLALARLAARAVKCGRKVTGQERAKDVMSRAAQQRHGFSVERLPVSTRTSLEDLCGNPDGQRHLDEYEERLTDNTQTPVDESAAFRVDFPDWLYRQSERDRRIIRDMMRDERTRDLAHKYGVSPGRVSQWRRQYQQDWNRFQGEEPAVSPPAGAA